MIVCAASNNAGKLKELRRILEQMGHEVKSLRDLCIDLDPEETGTTFAENARIKAEAFCKAGHHGDDAANNAKLLHEMADVPAGQRGAKFVSAICFMLPDGRALEVAGECPGSISFAETGSNGFGYDPLFVPARVGLPDGTTTENTACRSYAELTDAEKDAISHRGRAMEKLARELPVFLK